MQKIIEEIKKIKGIAQVKSPEELRKILFENKDCLILIEINNLATKRVDERKEDYSWCLPSEEDYMRDCDIDAEFKVLIKQIFEEIKKEKKI